MAQTRCRRGGANNGDGASSTLCPPAGAVYFEAESAESVAPRESRTPSPAR
jgi:hypothetical protein